MTAPTAICPTCAGARMVGHPCGIVVFDHSNGCTLRASEDSTAVADKDRLRVLGQFQRAATETELQLLGAVDGAPATRPVIVLVTHPGVRRRDFTPRTN